MNFNGLKYSVLAWYYRVKNIEPDKITETAHDLAQEKAKKDNQPIEIRVGNKWSTYFPCGCKVDFWPIATYNKLISWQCDTHKPHKGWKV